MTGSEAGVRASAAGPDDFRCAEQCQVSHTRVIFLAVVLSFEILQFTGNFKNSTERSHSLHAVFPKACLT